MLNGVLCVISMLLWVNLKKVGSIVVIGGVSCIMVLVMLVSSVMKVGIGVLGCISVWNLLIIWFL